MELESLIGFIVVLCLVFVVLIALSELKQRRAKRKDPLLIEFEPYEKLGSDQSTKKPAKTPSE